MFGDWAHTRTFGDKAIAVVLSPTFVVALYYTTITSSLPSRRGPRERRTMVNHIGSAAQASQSLSGDGSLSEISLPATHETSFPEFQTVEQIMEMTAKLKARDEGGTQSLAFRLNGEVALLGKEIEEANGNSLERDNRIMLPSHKDSGPAGGCIIIRLANCGYIRALEATIKIVGFETSLSYTRLTPHQYRPNCCCGSRSNVSSIRLDITSPKLSYSVSRNTSRRIR